MQPNQVFFGPPESVGPRPEQAIRALTLVVVAKKLNEDRVANPDDIARLLDYMTFLEMKAGVLDSAMVNLMNLPKLIAQAAEVVEAKQAQTPNKWTYNVEGHVCGETGRKAMTVTQVLELMKDDPDSVRSFTYNDEAGKMGLDPWRLVDSIDPSTDGGSAILWFDNGGSHQVALTTILYVQQPKPKTFRSL